jgi:hypothetical protein
MQKLLAKEARDLEETLPLLDEDSGQWHSLQIPGNVGREINYRIERRFSRSYGREIYRAKARA